MRDLKLNSCTAVANTDMTKIVLSRIAIAVLSLTLISPTSISAQSSEKQRPARSVEVKKVFGYYDVYLRLAPHERDGFNMSYQMTARDGGAFPQMTYRLGNVRTPIQIAPNGKVLTMPDARMFQTGQIEIAAGQPSASMSLDVEPIIPLSRTISVADASNPLNDYAAAVRQAGPLAILAPKFSGILFIGGTGGQAVFANGRRLSLPTAAGGTVFKPSAPSMRGAISLTFPTAPNDAVFAK